MFGEIERKHTVEPTEHWYNKVIKLASDLEEPELLLAAKFMLETERFKIHRDNESDNWRIKKKYDTQLDPPVRFDIGSAKTAAELLFELAEALKEMRSILLKPTIHKVDD